MTWPASININADCGTGAGGFKSGNTCAKSGGRESKVGDTVTIDGNKYVAESFDGDDTFPPAIAHYEIKDGHIFYTARNGSEGVVTGSKEDAEKWIKEVQKEVQRNPPEQSKHRAWTTADGGQGNIDAAKAMVESVSKTFGIDTPTV